MLWTGAKKGLRSAFISHQQTEEDLYMRRKYILIAVLVWALLLGMGLYIYNKPHASIANVRADYSLDAKDLYQQFQQDETVSNRKYLDKIIEVKGTVAEVQHSGKSATIELKEDSAMGGINCSFTNLEKNIQIPSKGSLLTIKGKCSGFLMDVNLVDCALKE